MFSRRTAAMVLPLVLLALLVGPSAATAPGSVTIAGSLQSELGCPGDWDPSCSISDLGAVDGGFAGDLTIPAGSYEYKAALDHSWTVNYGAGGVQDGPNIPLAAPGGKVHFAFDETTHLVADSVNSDIVTAPGSYQSELGCSGDWDPGCLKSWLETRNDGVYSMSTRNLPVGDYEAKAALNGSWDVNYGAGGIAGGANIKFSVTQPNQLILFSFDSHTHVLTIKAGHAVDDNVEWDGLRFDSRDTLYRTPQGAVPAGTPTTLRFRTFHDDVTSVKLRDFSVQENAEHLVSMVRVAAGVSCYQASLATESCDFWQATLPNTQVDIHWYRFIVSDGSKSAYYGDDTAALDGGLGATTDVRARLELRTDGVRPVVLDTILGAERGRLPDLPGPVPERRRQERPEDRRRPVRPDGREDALERASRGAIAGTTTRRARPDRCSPAMGRRTVKGRTGATTTAAT